MNYTITIISLLTLALFNGCDNYLQENKEMKNNKETEIEKPTLQSILDVKKAAFEAKASPEKIAMYAEGIAFVENSGVIENAKNVGDKAPEFTLLNASGKQVSLAKYLEKGPVVLTWYRGGWCPYCNLTLKRLQEELPNFTAEGASLLALTPELPDSSLTTTEKDALTFEVLSDIGNEVGREYGIVYQLSSEVAESYQGGFDLHAYNGDESDELPLAATYIIGTDGIIKYAFLDAEYRNRAEPSEILKILKTLH